MKQRALYLSILLFATIYSCSDTEQVRDQIVGRWQYDTETILAQVKADQSIPHSQYQMVESAMSIYQTAVFDFQEDGTLILESPGGDQVGTWNLSENGKEVSINFSGEDQPNRITALTETQFTLEALPDGPEILYPRIFIAADPVEATTTERVDSTKIYEHTRPARPKEGSDQ